MLLASVAGAPTKSHAQVAAPAVDLQQQRTYEFEADGVQISTDFPGGALADIRRIAPDHYEATIAPENKPINRSPWYAMSIAAQDSKAVTITLTYAHGRHRYLPKLSRDEIQFDPIDRAAIQEDPQQRATRFTVDVGPEPVWIAAQELFTSEDYQRWMDRLADHDAVDLEEIGQSAGGRTLHLLMIGEDTTRQNGAQSPSRYVVLFGRQHPPEVSGGVAMRAFIEAIIAETELADRFRRTFVVLAFPLINPDGVDHGFWRHNFGGKDLNRDWGPFTQPETRQVRDAIRERLDDSKDRVFVGIDFHSTFNNIFYTPADEVQVKPKPFVADWLQAIRDRHPDIELPESASHNPRGTTAKTWFVEHFGAPGITYEVADDFDRDTTRAIAGTAAEAMMRLLLAEVRQTDKQPSLRD